MHTHLFKKLMFNHVERQHGGEDVQCDVRGDAAAHAQNQAVHRMKAVDFTRNQLFDSKFQLK